MKFSNDVFRLCTILDDMRLTNIIFCDTSMLCNAVDFYIIATATSSTQAKSALDKLIETVQEDKSFVVCQKEGYNISDWFVADLESGFVHIFTKNEREKYNLEKLVNEGKNILTFEKMKKQYEKNLEKQTKVLQRSKK